MKLSVVISNYNYGQFLGEAIQSALDYSGAGEVIVIDDGSTDESLEIAAQFGSQIRVISKENGGQGSVFNLGYQEAKGEWIYFLDADDRVLPNFNREVPKCLSIGNVSKIHFRLKIFGNRSGIEPRQLYRLPSGNCSQEILRGRHIVVPTSGNVYARRFLEQILPMPGESFRICADSFLNMHAPFHGEIIAIDHLLAGYRIHGDNNYANSGISEKRFAFRYILTN